VRRIVHAESNRKRVAGAVAELLEPYLQVEDLLTQDQMQPDAKKYRQHLLTMKVDLSELKYPDGERRSVFCNEGRSHHRFTRAVDAATISPLK